jgi:predicted alpha/beta superfamily hydrolase
MTSKAASALLLCVALASCTSDRAGHEGHRAHARPHRTAAPLVIGESFALESRVLGEVRRVNVYVPTVYGQEIEGPLPVLYMLDGGLDEGFLHVAGLVQVLVSNGGMRPFTLVGIPNTQRRRDLTGPTSSAEDRTIAPVVGGSGAFRRFVREELMPAVRARCRTTDESAIVGESLAGLFVVETLMLEPELFDTYIAIDPSVWWDNERLVKDAEGRRAPTTNAPQVAPRRRSVFLANSNEPTMSKLTERLAQGLASASNLDVRFELFPAESHATIYHPAALTAFRALFAPPPAPAKRE